MKKYLIAAALATLASASFAADVGVSINIGQPGFYGRIVLGNVPQPQVIYAEPMIIQPSPVIVNRQPIYLRVPPGHERNWSRYCARYSACGQPVYFVQDNWYRNVYAPHYREQYDGRHQPQERREERGNRGNHYSHDNNGKGNQEQWKKHQGNDRGNDNN